MKRSPLFRRYGLGRRNKFSAVPVHDLRTGESFDSKGEHARWGTLQLLQRAGEISELTLHPKVVLLQKTATLPEIAWRVDYSYREKGRTVWEDWKPRPMTPRETLMCKLWKRFGPGILRITGPKGVIKDVFPNARLDRQEEAR